VLETRARAPRRVAIAAAVTAAGLTVPAGVADAARLTPLSQCYAEGDRVPLGGSGFTADARVRIHVQHGDTYEPRANGAGVILTWVKAPKVGADTVRPRSFTVTATDSVDPAGVAAVSMFVTKTLPVSNAPVSGNPTAVTTWQFAGFTPRRTIYGHFRLKGRTVRTVRFGRASDRPCGYLRVRARRVPVPRLRAGRWRLQIDERRRYNQRVTPRYVVTFSILRSPRLGR
jgi:hypothetical protein